MVLSVLAETPVGNRLELRVEAENVSLIIFNLKLPTPNSP